MSYDVTKFCELRDWMHSLSTDFKSVCKSPKFEFQSGLMTNADCFVTEGNTTIRFSLNENRNYALTAELWIDHQKKSVCRLLKRVDKDDLDLAKNMMLSYAGNELTALRCL